MSPLVEPARQARSHASLQRLVDAAMRLLCEHDFEAISIQQLCGEANLAVGTFYTRFRTKDDLLPYLYDQYDCRLSETLDCRFKALSTRSSLADRVDAIVAQTIRLYREHRGFWRSIYRFASVSPECIAPDVRRRRHAQIDRFIQYIVESPDARPGSVCRDAVEESLMVVMAVCKDQILMREASRGIVPLLSDRALRRCLVGMALSHISGGQAEDSDGI